MKTALALCALGVAFAVTRASVSDERSLLEERVEKAWASESSSEANGGTIEELPSAEAVPELRSALNAEADGSREGSSDKTPPPSDPEGQYQRALSFADIKSSALAPIFRRFSSPAGASPPNTAWSLPLFLKLGETAL